MYSGRFVRDIGVPPEAAARIHDDRFQQLVREGRISDAHQISRYVTHRRRAILVAAVLDLETRLTDAVLDMADKLIGGLFGLVVTDVPKVPIWKVIDFNVLRRGMCGNSLISGKSQLFQLNMRSSATEALGEAG